MRVLQWRQALQWLWRPLTVISVCRDGSRLPADLQCTRISAGDDVAPLLNDVLRTVPSGTGSFSDIFGC
jgi:hypothetical protein